MRFRFTARTVTCECIDQVHILGFADDPNQPDDFVILQRALAFDDQDRALGMDTWHLQICDDGPTGYGGIDRVTQHARGLTLHMSSGPSWLGELEALDIDLDDPARHPDLRRWLALIFDHAHLE